MDYKSISQQIIELQDSDLALRNQLVQRKELEGGYHPEMEALHNKNAEILNGLMDEIGYPTIDKVGKAANEAAWLVIQHAISKPDFMRKGLQLLISAVNDNQANPRHLAYLTDRIATFEGKPQQYGTQFDWDDNGKLSPQPYDDLVQVNRRRKAIGLNSLEEQTLVLRQRAEDEHETPPADFEKRKRDIEQWKRKVGWIE